MKNSLEALDNLTYCVNGMERKEKYYNIIKKDLECLEKLEEDNKKLKEKVNHLKNVKNRWVRNYKFVEKENEKLKQALEILKDKIEFEDLGEMQSGNVYRGYFNDCFDEEEVKSIKEVLGDE